jgi:excisionase family DNA binding protein
MAELEHLNLADRLALRPAEVARALGVSERSVRQILPELPHTRIGTAVVVPIDDLKQWLRDRAKQERSAVDQAVDEVLTQLEADHRGASR